MKQKILTTTCETINLRKIRTFVLNKLHELGIEQKLASLIVLAVDEVCANIMIHSNKCDEDKDIELCVTVNDCDLTVEIYDAGQAFNPNNYKEPDLKEVVENRKKGGIGMMIVRRVMDEIVYETRETRNVCRMVKRIE